MIVARSRHVARLNKLEQMPRVAKARATTFTLVVSKNAGWPPFSREPTIRGYRCRGPFRHIASIDEPTPASRCAAFA